MTKLLAVAALLASSTAFADPRTLTLGFQIGTRHYGMRLAPDSCGSVEAKAKDQHDEIKVCSKPDGKDLRLDIEWSSYEGDRELRNRSTVIVARGDKFDLDGGTAKLGVTLQ